MNGKAFDNEELQEYRDAPAVYFISDGQGHMKVGVASDIVTRLSSMQVGNASELQVVHLIQTETLSEAYRLESKIHDALQHSRIRGEWFRFDDAMSYLQGNTKERPKGKPCMADECPQFDIKDAIRLWIILLEEVTVASSEDEFIANVSKRYSEEMPDYWKAWYARKYAERESDGEEN